MPSSLRLSDGDGSVDAPSHPFRNEVCFPPTPLSHFHVLLLCLNSWKLCSEKGLKIWRCKKERLLLVETIEEVDKLFGNIIAYFGIKN